MLRGGLIVNARSLQRKDFRTFLLNAALWRHAKAARFSTVVSVQVADSRLQTCVLRCSCTVRVWSMVRTSMVPANLAYCKRRI